MNASTKPAAQDAGPIIFALESRRFVIIRPDEVVRPEETERFAPADPDCQGIHDLKPGDEVIYQGQRDSVRSLAAY